MTFLSTGVTTTNNNGSAAWQLSQRSQYQAPEVTIYIQAFPSVICTISVL